MTSLPTTTASAGTNTQHLECSAPEADSPSTKLDARLAVEILPLASRLFDAAPGMTRSRTDTEDLVQETYLKTYPRFHQYEPGTNITAWLYRILTSTYISRYRKAKRSPTRASTEGVEDWQLAETASHDPIGLKSAEVETLAQMSSEAVKEVLDALSEG